MPHFHSFKETIAGISLPTKFTFPFYYEPHLLAKIAAKELQQYLATQKDFEHNFGLTNVPKNAIGKMFGVLVVKNKQGELGYLCAFSGKLNDNSLPELFVPPVFNMRTQGSFYRKGENELNELTLKIAALKANETFAILKKEFKTLQKNIDHELAQQRQKMTQKRKIRKEKKARFKKENATTSSLEASKEGAVFMAKLTQESYNDQFYYKELHEFYQQKLKRASTKLVVFENELRALKKERKEKSNFLQQTLFSKYAFLNQQKEAKHLLAIFDDPKVKPPAGSGECAAPKLLQYAFANDLKPICMAEFWWGISPNAAVRKHKNFYPACQGRCKPILGHMLKGVELEENKMVAELQNKKELDIFFEDDDLIIVNKPHEFLSVPGKEIKDAVLTRIKKKYPNATGSLVLHRLDMSTSGILIFTKNAAANKFLQGQFINRTIQKRYVALLDGILPEDEGTISLPLRLDIDDRPKQLVDFNNGKPAETKWKVVQKAAGKTRVHFYPVTGRTHQLRVHAAHKDGLNTPIVGDDLYGTKANRLHLHAEYISFIHPKTKEEISFRIPAPF